MILQADLSCMNSMYMLGLAVVGLLRDPQSIIYTINLKQTNLLHNHQVLLHHPNQVARMQLHHHVASQGMKNKSISSKRQMSGIPIDLPTIQLEDASQCDVDLWTKEFVLKILHTRVNKLISNEASLMFYNLVIQG